MTPVPRTLSDFAHTEKPGVKLLTRRPPVPFGAVWGWASLAVPAGVISVDFHTDLGLGLVLPVPS